MKRRWMLVLGIATCVMTPAVHAGWPEFQHACKIDQQRNNAWPHPFRGADATAAVAPFEIMRNNGWRAYNTLPTALFTGDHQLTDAGRLRVDWIITQAPQDRRAVFVLRGASEKATNSRVEAVQLAISEMVPVGPLPQIFVTDIEPTASPGQYQSDVNRAMIKSMPVPRIGKYTGLNTPAQTATTSGSSAGTGK